MEKYSSRLSSGVALLLTTADVMTLPDGTVLMVIIMAIGALGVSWYDKHKRVNTLTVVGDEKERAEAGYQ